MPRSVTGCRARQGPARFVKAGARTRSGLLCRPRWSCPPRNPAELPRDGREQLELSARDGAHEVTGDQERVG